MNHYKFPVINHINDVLPHIEGRKEFIVAEREDYTVINYMVSMFDTFDMTDENDLGGAIRRECRGIIFYKNGKIMSRPFHKFFNIGEREETQLHVMNMNKPHTIYEKMDGSMIRGLIVDGKLRLATKMGVTDIAEEAEKLLTKDQYDWLYTKVCIGFTPIFEYVSPTNKIVVNYEKPELVLLAIRDTVTGEYCPMNNLHFKTVDSYGSLGSESIQEYVNRSRLDEGREGDIIRFEDGHMVKCKNDWYVRIHKTKDIIQSERNIADIIINEQLDDILPMLDEVDYKKVKDFEKKFDLLIENVVERLEGLVLLAKTLHDNKKDVALQFIPNLLNKDDASFVFSGFDGKNIRELVIEKIKGSVGNGPKFDKLMEWMEK